MNERVSYHLEKGGVYFSRIRDMFERGESYGVRRYYYFELCILFVDMRSICHFSARVICGNWTGDEWSSSQ